MVARARAGDYPEYCPYQVRKSPRFNESNAGPPGGAMASRSGEHSQGSSADVGGGVTVWRSC
jgi:hypothetical protein